METTTLHYNDAAEPITVQAWRCIKCDRVWIDEHMARLCCSKQRDCEDCGQAFTSHYSNRCDNCGRKRNLNEFMKLPLVGLKTGPLYLNEACSGRSATDDGFYWEPANAREKILEHPPAILFFQNCHPNGVPEFDMNEFLCDELADGETVYAEEAEKVVNDWIAANSPFSWYPDEDERVDPMTFRLLFSLAEWERITKDAGLITEPAEEAGA